MTFHTTFERGSWPRKVDCLEQRYGWLVDQFTTAANANLMTFMLLIISVLYAHLDPIYF